MRLLNIVVISSLATIPCRGESLNSSPSAAPKTRSQFAIVASSEVRGLCYVKDASDVEDKTLLGGGTFNSYDEALHVMMTNPQACRYRIVPTQPQPPTGAPGHQTPYQEPGYAGQYGYAPRPPGTGYVPQQGGYAGQQSGYGNDVPQQQGGSNLNLNRPPQSPNSINPIAPWGCPNPPCGGIPTR